MQLRHAHSAVQCAAASELNNKQKQAYCAKFIDKARKEKESKAVSRALAIGRRAGLCPAAYLSSTRPASAPGT